MKIDIHTLKWREDEGVKDGDDAPAGANILCVAELDGQRYDNVVATKVKHSADFAEVWVCFVADVSVQSHTLEEWEERFGKPWAPLRAPDAKNGLDELLATGEVPLVPAGSWIVADEYHGGVMPPVVPPIGDDVDAHRTGDDLTAPENT